ncbi:GNAT family N-acetyltransferase [Ktedonobacter racemifer]|uniref:GCN5-related N-acetyltransferase n=1 Tax=Ktedonobacter racemifer DSM 44963 TaxID=485913 RepID=D6U0N3_KTERA|nr:GNAT family N-acetyltransferase [Ktedonobacter racemifer]EFH82373.1 GCN5-related N-acetyltransferase [Ktedonobacter racemifer DSM 44963]
MAQHKERLELVKPDVKYAQAYLAMIDAHFASGEEYNYNNMWLAREDFAAFVRELEDEAQGIGLLVGLPRQQTYFLLKDGVQIIGEIRFRPHLEEPYEKLNGHVGYNIHPAYRGQGYGTRQLALLLEEARQLALPGVSMTIEDENPSSVRVIQKNGGRLLRVMENPPSIRVEEENGELVVKDTTNEGERCALWWIDL